MMSECNNVLVSKLSTKGQCSKVIAEINFSTDIELGSKFIFGLGSTCATRCKFLGAQWTPLLRRTCLKGSLHSHLSAESLKNRKGCGMNWKQCINCREKRQIKHALIQGKWFNFIVWSLNVSYL